MTIVNPEELTLWPRLMLPMCRLRYIDDDRDAIFIVVADETLIGIRSVPSHYPVPFV